MDGRESQTAVCQLALGATQRAAKGLGGILGSRKTRRGASTALQTRASNFDGHRICIAVIVRTTAKV